MNRLRFIVVSCLLCFGFWQLGQGAYIPAKAWVAQELMQRAWRKSGETRAPQAPWPWADTWPVARLSAKGGAIELIVLSGGSGRTLAFGPGHMSVSVLPGETGNSVIAGHRDTHFQFLKFLTVGESLLIEMPDGRNHLYRVTGIDVRRFPAWQPDPRYRRADAESRHLLPVRRRRCRRPDALCRLG